MCHRGLDWRLTETILSPRRLFLVAIETVRVGEGFFGVPSVLAVMDTIIEMKLHFSPWSLLGGRMCSRGWHLLESTKVLPLRWVPATPPQGNEKWSGTK